MVVKLVESQTATLTLNFFNEDNDPITPSSGTYTIEDIESGELVREETEFTPTSSSHIIYLEGSDTGIVDDSQSTEQRKILVDFYWNRSGTEDGHGVGEIFYLVKNRVVNR